MKKRPTLLVLAAVFWLLFAADRVDAGQTLSPKEVQPGRYASRLLTPEQIDGRVVQTRQGEQVGTVDKVILDHREGRIAYIVVTSGGFWGVGGEKAVIPWKAIRIQEARLQVLEQDQWKRQPGVQPGVQGELPQRLRHEPVLVLDVDREVLMKAPQGEMQDSLDRRRAEDIHRHYGVSPYWEAGEERGE